MHHIQEVIRCEGGNEYKEGQPSWMKSRKANCIVEAVGEAVIVDEDLESIDSALWQQLEVDEENAELEGFRLDAWKEEVEEATPEPPPAPAPAPLRRSNRRK
jgi:hypothetical protein